ncbi:hypothetical protein B0T18DRAFT_470723 [Schizothecium vesticola]|uniref:Zn(2)-C6 fungal-type domain-containing protein n=1 Tax=Schizothecium vesticola TaxID=314040 RepID=A0AA40JYN3_9PEZI|nr:hypothetical protein B0T18DRAFT_470723 [Schizothecium vesticola]
MEAQDLPQGQGRGRGEYQNPGSTLTGQLSCTQCRSRKLRCDRKRPRCDRCLEKNESCTYPESRQRGLGRRKTVRDLEERVEELEGLLRAANIGAAAHGAEQDESLLGVDAQLPSFPLSDLPFEEPPSALPAGPAAGELVGLGLFEQLPSFDLVDTLTALFFQSIHAGAPMLHRATYTAAVRLPPHMRPPMCLQYIVMASAAATSPAYRHLSEPFYQRARVYAEADELRGQGEVFTTVAHVQSWCLISAYECHVHAIFTRASTSLCRAVRIAQMLKLYQLDSQKAAHLLGSSLPPPRSYVEAEERRRTWWVVFMADRYLTSTTGWPSLIDERHVRTNLPSAEPVFASGTENPYPTSLSDGLGRLEQGLGEQISPFAIRILAANELLHALGHSAEGSVQDPSGRDPNSTHWHRHREIDTNLATLTHLLPESFDLARNPRSLDTVLVHICTAMGALHLHRPFVQTLGSFNTRLLPAAQTILSVLRAAAAANFVATAIRNPLVPFAAYMAASVLLTDCLQPVSGDENQSSEDGLEYLANILVSFAGRSPLVKANMLQLAADLQRVGRGWLMERALATGESGDMEGVQILAGGGMGMGVMLFCPALSPASGGDGGQGAWGSLGGIGGIWSLGGGGGSGLAGGSNESVLAGLSDVGLPGSAGSAVLQAGSSDGLFTQLSTMGLQGFMP